MLISIIIPVYNAAGTIREALESVGRQPAPDMGMGTTSNTQRPTPNSQFRKGAEGENRECSTHQPACHDPGEGEAPDCEIIVVDDASKDDTAEVVRRFQLPMLKSPDAEPPTPTLRHSDTPIHLFSLSSNSGPAAARNRGIKEARGEWIAFLDSDDVWLPGKMKMQLEMAAKHPEVAMWCGGVTGIGVTGYRSNGGEKEKKFEQKVAKTAKKEEKGLPAQVLRKLTLAEFALSNPVATSTVMVKKAVLEEVGGFDESFRGPEDYDLWMRIAAKYPVMQIDEPLAGYRRTHGSLSMDAGSFLPQVLRVLDKAHGSGGVLEGRGGKQRARAYQYYCAAWSASVAGMTPKALRLSLRSFMECPLIFDHPNVGSLCRMKLLWRILSTSRDVEEEGNLPANAANKDEW